jgi:hypothetical protein
MKNKNGNLPKIIFGSDEPLPIINRIVYVEGIKTHELHESTCLPDLNIVLILKGSGKLKIDHVEYKVKAFHAIVIFPGQMCTWTLDKDIDSIQLVVHKLLYEKVIPYNKAIVGKRPISVFELKAETFSTLTRELKEIKRIQESTYVANDMLEARFQISYLILKSLCMDCRTVKEDVLNSKVL